ncbi:uncharacterized protein LOC133316278 [Gastrolobium bilobum]|uniref:uncharacterized protein LOC133316278 n=1 Tax=Gastrolobium bilobum TaxID=150636 RepID=UPI002AB2BA5D|nr:uncharacterized protein LOC133316278 [Gastrolobium bilobum]
MQAVTEQIIEQLIKLIKLTIMFFQVLLVLIEQLNKLIKYLFQQQRKVQVPLGYQNIVKKNSPLEAKKKPASGQRSKFLCSICFDSKAESDMFRGGECNHPFCTDCISKHVATQIQQNILNVYCPNPNCSMELKPQHLQTTLPKDFIDRWESARLESSIAAWQKTYCPFKNCSVLLVNDGREVVTESECPFCHRLFCAQCKVPWHAQMNCKKFQKKVPGQRSKRKVQGQRSKRKVHGQRSKFLCSICFDSKAEYDLFRGGECNHPFCTDCISKHVATQIQQNILNVHCPNPNCSMELKPQHLQTLLPKEVIDRWESARYESSIAGWQKTYCPFKDCSVLLVNDGEVVIQSECPFCHRLFCAQCKVPWHARMNCNEFQKLKNGKRDNDLDRKFLELAKGKMWQKCPKCYMYVQRRSGCEHMTCRCGCHFCYQCGENWKFGHLCCRLRSK